MKKYLLAIIVLIMSYTVTFAELPVSNMVIPVSYFIDHVKQLSLTKNNLAKYRKTSIVGISGIGKSQLARMYAYEYQDNYNIIWFIDCNLDLNGELVKLAKAINAVNKANNKPEFIPEEANTVKQEVMSYLTTKDKWLLVFDNLKVQENDRVQEFVNWEHNGHLIFGSQDAESLPNIVKMTAFEKQDAVALAASLLENGDTNIAEFLAQEFAGYPILIVQGAQLLNYVPGLDRTAYQKKIRHSADKIELNICLAVKELKPSAKELVSKIALINNQAFSKDLLRIITSNPDGLDDDIYQLSKFALIANINSDEANPIFEMHDVIAEKIINMNSNKNNRIYLDHSVTKLVNAVPKSAIKGHLFRNAKTITESISIMAKNGKKYDINLYDLMSLNLQLVIQYQNSSDWPNVKELVNWFNEYNKKGKFRIWLMNNDEKARYATYLRLVGAYYWNINNHIAIDYFYNAREVLNKVNGYENYKNSAILSSALTELRLGQISEAKKNIQEAEQMQHLVNEADVGIILIVKAMLSCVQGDHTTALEQINSSIELCTQNGLNATDLSLTGSYILRTEILNCLEQYQEAYEQAKILYDMHRPVKREDQSVFSRIFTQMSRAELGLGKIEEAVAHAQKAIAIFCNDPTRNNENLTISQDTDLAKALVAEGDALAALGQIHPFADGDIIASMDDKHRTAIKSYDLAELIYWNNYRDNMGNIDEVSRMYFSAAKASCHLQDKYWYIKFHDQHIKYFGAKHPRSIEMLNNMDPICHYDLRNKER